MAAANAPLSFEAALTKVQKDLELQFSLRKEQITALRSFIEKKDVFGVMPTGYGKSLIYLLAPMVAKLMGVCRNPMVIVVSPLIALMEDQVKEAEKLGLTAMQLGKDDQKDIRSGRCQLIFGSPESWFLKKEWRNMLAANVFQDNVLGIVVDEVHLTHKWGKASRGQKAFRESFAQLGELRSIVKEGTPILALTATADLDSRSIVKRQLDLDNATHITISPKRSTIRLGLATVSSDTMDCLNWVARKVKENGPRMLPIIIYCRTLTTCGKVYCHLKYELGEDCWVDRDPEHRVENRLIGMFHSQTLPHHKKTVLDSLSGNGSCRVVVATTALGMGLNFPNISHVIMYDSPNDVEAIVQEVGRAGRDGSQGHAIIYRLLHEKKMDEDVRKLLQEGKKSCFRKALYSHFEHNTHSVLPGHMCCSYCHSVCLCCNTGCGVAIPEYELPQQPVYATVKSREVTEDQKVIIRNQLYSYKLTLVQNKHLYTNSTDCTGFSRELINCVIEHSTVIFDLPFIMENLPVFSRRHGQKILKVFFDIFGDFEYNEVDIQVEDFLLPDQDYTGDDVDSGSDTQTTSSLESGFSHLTSD